MKISHSFVGYRGQPCDHAYACMRRQRLPRQCTGRPPGKIHPRVGRLAVGRRAAPGSRYGHGPHDMPAVRDLSVPLLPFQVKTMTCNVTKKATACNCPAKLVSSASSTLPKETDGFQLPLPCLLGF
jgi:hypothetical protein